MEEFITENVNVPKYLIDKVRHSSLAMYNIARMMSARKILTPGFRDVLGVNKAIYERIKKGEYDDLFILTLFYTIFDRFYHKF